MDDDRTFTVATDSAVISLIESAKRLLNVKDCRCSGSRTTRCSPISAVWWTGCVRGWRLTEMMSYELEPRACFSATPPSRSLGCRYGCSKNLRCCFLNRENPLSRCATAPPRERLAMRFAHRWG